MARQVIFKPRARYVPDPGPFEGVPEHLFVPLLMWLSNVLKLGSPMEDTDALLTVMMRLRIPPSSANGTGMNPIWASISKWIDEDHARMIEVADVLMDIRMTEYLTLDRILSEGGSLYISAENRIEERVDPLAKQAFVTAVQRSDNASKQLSEAWSKAYGRHPDASDAWDHAIKAVEAVLIDAVVPKQDKPTLGHVLRHLQTQGHLFKLVIPGPNLDYSVAPLIAMLELMWPNHDRHGNSQPRHTPTITEARGVVHVAVTIVQWARDGQIVRR